MPVPAELVLSTHSLTKEGWKAGLAEQLYGERVRL